MTTIFVLPGVKATGANLQLFGGVFSLLGMIEVVPFAFTWMMVLGLPDSFRKLFKLNTEAIVLILRELDFWVPFTMLCLSSVFALASFDCEGSVAAFLFVVVFTYTSNLLLGNKSVRTHAASAITQWRHYSLHAH